MAEPAGPDPRVPLAAERTLLAWIRTGLALIGFGFVVARLGFFVRMMGGRDLPAPPPGVPLWTGTALVLLGVAVQVAAAWRHRRFLRWWESGGAGQAPAGGFGVHVALVVAAVGLGLAAWLLASG